MSYWLGKKECDICHRDLTNESLIYDAATVYGPWALMDQACWFNNTSCMLGTGSGQRYELQQDGKHLKVEG